MKRFLLSAFSLIAFSPAVFADEPLLYYGKTSDPMTDVPQVNIALDSIEQSYTSIGTKEYVSMGMICGNPDQTSSDQVFLVIATPTVIGGETSRVGLRFDGGTPRYESWYVVKSGAGVQLPSDVRSNFISDLKKHKKLVFQWQAYRKGQPSTTVFDLTKLHPLLKRGEADGCDFS